MKVLIAYDGSECADAAIVDLKRAGLPANVEAVVMSVGETERAVCESSYVASLAQLGGRVNPAELDDSVTDQISEPQALASQAAARIRADFPGWKVTTESWIDEAEKAIVRKAYQWSPELIVLGSRGHSTLGRVVLGSVSQYVLHHTIRSVRISRHRLHSQDRPIRLLVAVDGSEESWMAVRAVAERNWPAATEVRVVGVHDSQLALASVGTTLGTSAAALQEEGHSRLSCAVHEGARSLRQAGLRAVPDILDGRPAKVLVTEAESWVADCIFVGAKAHCRLERFLLGSVADAVVSQAHCSVEIVRLR